MKHKKNPNQKSFSFETVRRLTIYLRNLKKLKADNIETISSDKITNILKVSPAQFRKDLSYFGEFGKRGVGYNVDYLITQIETIVGTHLAWNIALVGLGKVGSALLGFEGFSKFNIKITVVFDADPKKIGTSKHGIPVETVENIPRIIGQKGIKLAIITTPPEPAQHIADSLIAAGVRGILNFAPVILRAPENVFISNVDMACELESLIFFVKQNL